MGFNQKKTKRSTHELLKHHANVFFSVMFFFFYVCSRHTYHNVNMLKYIEARFTESKLNHYVNISAKKTLTQVYSMCYLNTIKLSPNVSDSHN